MYGEDTSWLPPIIGKTPPDDFWKPKQETAKWYEKINWGDMFGGAAGLIASVRGGGVNTQQSQASGSTLGLTNESLILVGVLAIGIIALVAIRR